MANESNITLHATTTLAKLTPPRLGDVYPRTPLYAVLDRANERPIVWVSGAPGAGKTTVVSAYLEARKQRTLWYQLDGGDSDPATFFHYLGIAARALAPRSRKILPSFTPEHLPSLDAFARGYFERLGALLAQPATLVFDNYHEVAADSPLHALLAEALPLLPAHVHVTIISRAEPPAAFARLRINRHLALLGADVFKLAPDEAAGLAQQLGYHVSEQHIAQLHTQTGGWTAGMLLLLEHSKISPAFETTGAAAEVLFDYFAGEVLHRMEPRAQHALLQLAFLPAMNASLAVALTQDEQAPALLEQLARRHYFTQRHAGVETSYQFHPLFKAFLQARARSTLAAPQLVALQQSTAQHLHRRGQIEDAAELLRDAGDWPAFAQLIGEHALTLAQQGRLQTLALWISATPAGIREQAPWLLYWLAQCRMMINPIEAREYSVKALSLFDQARDPAGVYLSWASVVYTFAVGWQDLRPLDHWLELFSTLEARYPEIPSAEITARVTCSMLVALTHRQPRHPDTERWTRFAMHIVNSPGDREHRVMIAAYLGIFYTWSGPLRRGDELISLVRPLLAAELSPLIRILWQCFVAMYSGARTAHAECLAAAEEARRIAVDSGTNAMNNVIGLVGVHASLAYGDVQGAEAWIKGIDALHDSGQIDYAVYYHCLGLIAIQKGENRQGAEHIRKSLALAQQHGNTLGEGSAHVALAQILFELGQPEQARAQLAMGRAVAKRFHSELLEYICWFGQASDAICYAGKTDWVEPLNSLLAMEKANGGMGVQLWPSARLAQVYAFALDHGIEVDYVRSVIRRRKLMPDTPPVDVENWPWPLKIYTLGRFNIVRDDVPLRFSGKAQKRPLELLQALVAFGGRDVPQRHLADTLWPQAEADAANAAFATTLKRLRRLLGDPRAIVLTEGKVTLDASVCWVDVWAFERAAAAATHEPERAARAFALYQGPFLGSDVEAPWALPLRERLASRMQRTVYQAAEACEQSNDWADAIACYQRGLDAEPLALEFYYHLMRCHAQQGEHARAIALYGSYRRALNAHPGQPHAAQVEALYRELQQNTH